MSQTIDLCRRISEKVAELLPGESTIRKGRLIKLAHGEAAVVDLDKPMICFDSDGDAKALDENVDDNGCAFRYQLHETQVVVKCKVFYQTPNTDEEALKIAKEFVAKITRRENDLIVQLMSAATFVPKVDYFRVRRFFKDLKRSTLVIPTEEINTFIPRSLLTFIRHDLDVVSMNNPNSLAIDFTLYETISPTLVDNAWIPWTE